MENKKEQKGVLVKDSNHLSLAYLTQAIEYLHLAEQVFSEMKNQGNNWLIISDIPTENHIYDNQTKWSDFNIIFPSLFIFYHGIELSIKGLLVLSNQNASKIHKFSILFSELEKQENIYDEIIEIIEKYINLNLLKETPLGAWIIGNNFNVDNLYERLRYPTYGNDSDILTNDSALKYKGRDMIPFINEIVFNIDKLRKLVVKQYREIENN